MSTEQEIAEQKIHDADRAAGYGVAGSRAATAAATESTKRDFGVRTCTACPKRCRTTGATCLHCGGKLKS